MPDAKEPVDPTPPPPPGVTTRGSLRKAFNSLARQRDMTVAWEYRSWITPRVTTGSAPGEERAGDAIGEKPLLIFVYDDPASVSKRTQAKAYEAIERLFSHERVALATRAFRAIRMSVAGASREPLTKEHTPEHGRLILLHPPTEAAWSQRGSALTPSKVLRAMEGMYRRQFEGSLSSNVGRHVRVLVEHDKLGRRVMDLEARIDAASSEVKRSRLEAQLTALRSQQTALDERLDGIWKLSAKKPRVAKAP